MSEFRSGVRGDTWPVEYPYRRIAANFSAHPHTSEKKRRGLSETLIERMTKPKAPAKPRPAYGAPVVLFGPDASAKVEVLSAPWGTSLRDLLGRRDRRGFIVGLRAF